MTVKGKGENYGQSMRKYRYLHFQNTRKIQKKGEMNSESTPGKLAPKNESKLFICEKHFQESDIVATSTDSNNRRKRKKQSEVLGHKRLKEDAVPCLWPGSPHLSKITSPHPTTFASSESRRENFTRLREEEELNKIPQDTFKSLDEFHEKEGQLNIPADVTKIQTIEYVLFLNLNVADIPKIIYSVQITADLQFIVIMRTKK